MNEGNAPEESRAATRRWPWIALATLVLGAVLMLMSDVEDSADVTAREAAFAAPTISTLTVAASPARAEVSAFAALRPQWDAEIRTAVSGRITEVHPAALAGTQVAEGTPLFSIERTQYETAVATAELALEEARLAYMQAENQVTLAQRQFDRDGAKAPNELALYLPQMRIAERSLASAEVQLQAAMRHLSNTEVTAPFSGFVTDRMASLGQTVAAGEALVHLSDDQGFELVAQLSQADWALLDQPIAGSRAQLFHTDGTAVGEAVIRQGGGFLDPETRQMRVFLEVSEPGDSVLSGDFLKVVFEGREIANTLTLPESALTREGYVWFVDHGNLLQRVEPEILFRAGDTFTIAAPDVEGTWRVATTPLGSFLPGQRVTPRQIGG
ncbi:MAG: efflux RND transporter periplasmic adaptor subunit [Pseudomonadota bacterium]